MELEWRQTGPLGVGPSPVYRATSFVNSRNSYDISGTDGYWYAIFQDLAKLTIPGGVWNLGWAPTLDMMKQRCQILDDYFAR